jgi:cobalt/nickel transport protein
MKPLSLLLLMLLLSVVAPVWAHFGIILPSDDIVSQNDPRTLSLQISFMHPFEGSRMDMARPREFGVVHQGIKTDLLDTLQADLAKDRTTGQAANSWQANYQVKRPGDHTFYVIPAPYWEPAEDLFIIHYTKVCVASMGLETGWDQPVGLETEIIPLTRPYGLWTGNLFSGQVLLHERPVPFAKIEVEYLNGSDETPSRIVAPDDAYITQMIRADAEGVFHYAMPRAGWWGFSALSAADRTLPHDGQPKDIELGALFWVYTRDID